MPGHAYFMQWAFFPLQEIGPTEIPLYEAPRESITKPRFNIALWSGRMGAGMENWVFMKRGRNLPKFWIFPKIRVCSY